MDNGLITCLVTLDLKKAFDMVDHYILIEKLRYYGFNEESVSWFRNYLNERLQATMVNGNISSLKQVEHGVPQGSILGPLLFLLFINDVSNVVKHCHLSLYADDTCLYFSSSDPNVMSVSVNEDLQNISSWLSDNKLILNITKSEYMLIGSQRRLVKFNDSHLTLAIGGESLNRVTKCKYLGVILDANLNWKHHVDHIRCKVVKSLFLLRKARPFITINIAKMLYHTIIQSHFDYCSPVWSNANKTLLNVLHILQKRALRIILKTNLMTRSNVLYQQSGIQPLQSRWKRINVTLIYKCVHHIAPEYLSNRVSLQNYEYSLRNTLNKILLPKPKTNFKRNSFLYASAISFNSLPNEIRSINVLSTFKEKINKYNFV